MQKFFLFVICVFISVAWACPAGAILQPRGPDIQPQTEVGQSQITVPPSVEPTDGTKIPLSNNLVTPAPGQIAAASDKEIIVNLANQDLTYFQGTQMVGEFKISSGLPGTPTPPGQYTVLKKKPLVDFKGSNYDFPNTKWNLMFKQGDPLSYYIHGAYWHHNFGHPMSHGCINVSYTNMEPLYNWADVGTKIIIE